MMASTTDKSLPVDPKTGAAGSPASMRNILLETGASVVQNFAPVKQICAHLNAFHVYASDPTRCVESNHYCTPLTEGALLRACRSRLKERYRYLLGYKWLIFLSLLLSN